MLPDRSFSLKVGLDGAVSVLDRFGIPLCQIHSEQGLDSETVIFQALLAACSPKGRYPALDPQSLIGPYDPSLSSLQLMEETWQALQTWRAIQGFEPTIKQVELAELLGVKRQAITYKINQGKLPLVRRRSYPEILVNQLHSPLREQALAFLEKKHGEIRHAKEVQ